jgi:glycosyltransferase involved in cell wall biosynthesis
LKLLLLGDFNAPTAFSNINLHIARLLKSKGVDLTVITHISQPLPQQVIDGIPVIGSFKGKFTFEKVKQLAEGFDVVLLSGTWFLWREVVPALNYHEIPFIAYTTCEGEVDVNYAGVLSDAEKILVPSNFVKNIFLKYFSSKKLEVLPHGVDTELFKPVCPQEDIVLVPCRYGNPRKQTDKITRAFTRLMYADKTKTLRLIFTGQPIPSLGIMDTPKLTDMPILYSKAVTAIDIGEAEGFCMSLIESMSCTRPIITLDAPPQNEIVTDRRLLVKVKETVPKTIVVRMGDETVYVRYQANIVDEEDLYDKLETAIEQSTELIASEAHNWRRKVEENYSHLNYNRIYELLEKLL